MRFTPTPTSRLACAGSRAVPVVPNSGGAPSRRHLTTAPRCAPWGPGEWHQQHKQQQRRLVARAAPPSPSGTSQEPQTLAVATDSATQFKALDAALALPGDAGEAAALEIMKELQAGGAVRAFGVGRGVNKRIYTLEELRLNKIEPEKLLSPDDKSLNFVRSVAQAAAAAGVVAAAVFGHANIQQLGGTVLALTFLTALDQIGNQGGVEALVLDSLGRVLVPSYARRVALHESGHFLVAYLVGLLPRAYTLSAIDAYRREGAVNVQAGTRFCDAAFVAELNSGRLSSSSLDRYTNVALAGVVTEYLRFGQAEGGLGDVGNLDNMFRSMQFSQNKADGEVRWAVLNVAFLLRARLALQDELAAAMQRGESVGQCIQLIERRWVEEEEA